MINYKRYIYSKSEYIRYGIVGLFVSWVVLMLFYRSFLFCFIVSLPITYGFLMYMKKVLIQQRQQKLTAEFKDLMESLVSALSAGYSMENAIPAAKKDLLLMYPSDGLIIREIDYMIQQMELGVSVGQVLSEWGERSKAEDIAGFATIYSTAKRTGGNLITVMRQTAKNISEKIEIKREIDTLISGKKLESKCMSIIPLLIILYLQVCSPGFLNPLYEGVLGRMVMTGALFLYTVSFLWIRKIMQFEF